MPTQPSSLGWGNAGSDPGTTKKAAGFKDGEKPAASLFNWITGKLSAWIDYLVLLHGVTSVTDSITWTKDTPNLILATPTAAHTFVLPTTGVKTGDRWQLKNLATVAGRNITINASGGALIWLVCPSNECELVAVVDTPTDASGWKMLNRGWPIHARVHKSADQTNVTELTGTLVTFNTVLYDPASLFNDAGDKLVFPLPGVWRVKGSAYMEGDTGFLLQAGLYFNGAEDAGGGTAEQDYSSLATNTSAHVSPEGEFLCTTPGTDYVTLIARYTGIGTNVGDILAAGPSTSFDGNKATWLSAQYIGPL